MYILHDFEQASDAAARAQVATTPEAADFWSKMAHCWARKALAAWRMKSADASGPDPILHLADISARVLQDLVARGQLAGE